MAWIERRPGYIMPSMGEPHPAAPLRQNRSRAEQEVAHLSQTIINLLNARDFSNPWFTQHVSENVWTEVQGDASIGRDHFIRQYRVGTIGSNEFHVQAGNVTAIVDEKQASATAIVSQYLSRYQSDERRMAATILFAWNWDRARERWILQSGQMMYGTPCFFTDDIYATG